MAGYIEYFGLDNWYANLTLGEQTALRQRIPGLLTETFEPNMEKYPGVYVSLSSNLDAPPGIMKTMKLDISNIHILAHVLERNIDNHSLLNPHVNGAHEYKQREFNYYKCMASKSLATFYFWNRDLLGEEKIHIYATETIRLYPEYQDHSKFLRIQNLESLTSRLKGYYESSFILGNRTPSTHPDLYTELTSNIYKHSQALYEVQNSFQFSNDKFFWNYARFLAVRKRYREAESVVKRAIEMHISYEGAYLLFLKQIFNGNNFGGKDFWSI